MLKQKTTSNCSYQCQVPGTGTYLFLMIPGGSDWYQYQVSCMISVVLDFSNSHQQHVAKLSRQDVTLVDCVFVFGFCFVFCFVFFPSSVKSLLVVSVLIHGCINLDGSYITPVNCLFLIFAAVAGIRWQLAAAMQVNCCFCFPFLFCTGLLWFCYCCTYHQFQNGTASGCNQEPPAATRNLQLQPGATSTSINLSSRNVSSKNISSKNVSSGNQVPEGIGIVNTGRLIVIFSFLEPPCLTVVSVFLLPHVRCNPRGGL